MAGTRSSARQAAAAAASSSPASSQNQTPDKKNNGAGSKRKGASSTSSPQAKRSKKSGKQEQQTTIEETMPTVDAPQDAEMKDAPQETDTKADVPAPSETKADELPKQEESKATNGSSDKQETEDTAKAETKVDEKPEEPAKQNGTAATEGDAVEESSKREESTPSSILEKGIIYFFFRGRVGIDEPSDVNDIARSYIILRPIPHGAKLGDGPIGDAGNNRMLALPKKVLPVSPKDRFMVFVEKANASMEDIKSSLSASDYMTKTAGSRHTPAAAPIGEGVYAITSTGRETHLAYILTIPSEISEVQDGIGLRQRGSYLTSAKNPESSAPANASLPKSAEYPKE
ncbi:MAG: hypothetical protein Q9220_004460 [cf. Caloplaca sp. 1 TL-2023]